MVDFKTNLNINDIVSDLSRRLRILEERYNLLTKKTGVIEQNLIDTNKRQDVEINKLLDKIKEINNEINDIKDKMMLMIKEMQNLAKHEDVEVLKKYIELWSPVKFVTADGVKKIVYDILNEEGLLQRSQSKFDQE